MRTLLLTLAVAAGLLTEAATASATLVTFNPGGATAGTVGVTSQFVFNTGRRTVICAGTSSSARYLTNTFPSVTLPFTLTDATDLQLTFTGCRLIGVGNVAIACARTARLRATGTSGPGPTLATPVALTAISCTVTFSGTCSVTIANDVPGTHDSQLGEITVSTTGQTLIATGSTNGSGGTCSLFPNDPSVTFSGGASALVFRESPKQAIVVI